MARNRLILQTKFEELLGTRNVYFQPPANVQMRYPCIVYNRDDTSAEYADNQKYRYLKRYQVTVIDADPDSQIPDRIAMLPLTRHDRFYTADNLNHDVFNLYF